MKKDLEEENRKIGSILKALRKHHKISIEKITKELEITPELLAKYESGEQPIHIDKQENYCKLVYINLEDLMTQARNMKTIE